MYPRLGVWLWCFGRGTQSGPILRSTRVLDSRRTIAGGWFSVVDAGVDLYRSSSRRLGHVQRNLVTTCAVRATYFNNRRVRSGTEVRIEAQSVASVLDSRSSDLYASVRVSSDAGTIPPKS